MVIESVRIKKVIKEVSKKEDHDELYEAISKILDYVNKHENMVKEVIDNNVKDIIVQMEDK